MSYPAPQHYTCSVDRPNVGYTYIYKYAYLGAYIAHSVVIKFYFILFSFQMYVYSYTLGAC